MYSPKKGLLTLVAATLSLFLASSPARAGLIAYFTFEGNANDVTGNGHNGTFSPTAPTLTPAGFQGSAYQFGAGGANTFITIPLDINPSALPQLTFGAWVNADVNDPVIRGILSHDNGGFDRTLDVDTRRDGNVRWCLFGPGPVVGGGVCDGLVVPGAWTFVAGRYDAALGIAQLTVNGAHFAAFTANPGAGETSTTIGRNPNFDFPFIGRIDEVFFFDEYLSNARLDRIRVHGVPEPSAFLLLSAGLAGWIVRARRQGGA